MPEGDTIHRTAARLRPALIGRRLERFEAQRLSGLRPRVGSVIEAVEATGKHLEITFDDGIVLHTHMRMSGSWHLYRLGETWRKRMHAARVVIQVEGWLAVCFNAPLVEVFRVEDRRRHPGLGSLGPDLCRADVDLEACVRRMAQYCDGHEEIGDVLLDQRICCGVGNVYKSEVLWATPARSAHADPSAGPAHVPLAGRDRRRLVAGEPRRRRARDGDRRSRGLRPCRQALLALPHAHRRDAAGRQRSGDVLVPGVPAARGSLTPRPPTRFLARITGQKRPVIRASSPRGQSSRSCA